MYVGRNELGLIIDRCGMQCEGFTALEMESKEALFYLDDANRSRFDMLATGGMSEEDQQILKTEIEAL